MKKLYDFVFCQDPVLTRDCIFYLVAVGRSERDQQAMRYVLKRTQGNAWFALHNNEAQRFIEQCAVSLFPGRSAMKAAGMVRRKLVDIKWLASFLRSAPGPLLNSLRIRCVKPFP